VVEWLLLKVGSSFVFLLLTIHFHDLVERRGSPAAEPSRPPPGRALGLLQTGATR